MSEEWWVSVSGEDYRGALRVFRRVKLWVEGSHGERWGGEVGADAVVRDLHLDATQDHAALDARKDATMVATMDEESDEEG